MRPVLTVNDRYDVGSGLTHGPVEPCEDIRPDDPVRPLFGWSLLIPRVLPTAVMWIAILLCSGANTFAQGVIGLPCIISLSPNSASVSAGANSATFAIQVFERTAGACGQVGWEVKSDVNWITIA